MRLIDADKLLEMRFSEGLIDGNELLVSFNDVVNAIRQAPTVNVYDPYIEYYKDFRKELDNMCVPLIVKDLKKIEPIIENGELVGMVGGFTDYIDCVYVKPEHRRKGLARMAVLKFVKGNLGYGIRLHIINNNTVAKDFWSSIFELKEIGSNPIDTLYEIVKTKELNDEQRKAD